MTRSCPTCGEAAQGKHSPFCSLRCAHVDLGRWLAEQYATPSAEEPDSDDLESLGGTLEEEIMFGAGQER